MMNIEQTKKMNFMIKELTKSGMVNSFEDAIDQASNLYTNSMPGVTHCEEPKTEIKQEGTAATYTSQISPTVDQFDLFERKIHSTMRENNGAIAAEMNKLWNELKSMKDHYHQELERLGRLMETLKVSKQQEPNAEVRPSLVQSSSQQCQQQNAQPAQMQTAQVTPDIKKEEDHPRQGGFSPNNIDLESYFYFGNK